MFHSIIIPSHNRLENLRSCIDSIGRSAHFCNEHDYEIIVAGSDSITDCSHVRCVPCETSPPHLVLSSTEPKPYWKTRSLNVGLAHANGEVLTFLDADAYVGERFMSNARFLVGSNLTKLCYRVRYSDDPPNSPSNGLTRNGFEAYGAPDQELYGNQDVVFGNSQFSISRQMLGNLRWDENYFGRGFEDLAMNRSIWQRAGGYAAAIMTAEPYAMWHRFHSYTAGYGTDEWNNRNMRRYYGVKCVRVFGTPRDRERLQKATMACSLCGSVFDFNPPEGYENYINRDLDMRWDIGEITDEAELATQFLRYGLSVEFIGVAWKSWSEE